MKREKAGASNSWNADSQQVNNHLRTSHWLAFAAGIKKLVGSTTTKPSLQPAVGGLISLALKCLVCTNIT